ncbi:MAG: prolipoprotein diacylglyceryl transferase, partial [Spirulinaceae cyanobacterium RM2_2_10]|nr:prolipoprotein diacylglyceryl transferase [Spirulinaceae cyanobacterium RM2_2_10]
LLWYPSGRFWIEFLRTRFLVFPGTPFNVVHILTAIAVIGSALVLGRRKLMPSRAQN